MHEIIIYGDEKYRCPTCSKQFFYQDVWQTWKCPDCSEGLEILIELEGKRYTANRVSAIDVRSGDHIVLGIFIHAVLNSSVENDNVRLAVKNFGVVKYSKSRQVVRIIGGDTGW